MDILKKVKDKIEIVLFIVCALTFVLPVCLNQYFLTGDGPTHLYNSKVLLDYFSNQHWEFYQPFYYLNKNFEPNWLSHATLTLFMSFVKPVWAEKAFILLYAVLFCFSLGLLIDSINPRSSFVAFLGLPFVFHHVFQMGFYNYSTSIALFFLIAALFNYYRNQLTPLKLFGLALLLLFCYFSHPIGFVYSLLYIFLVEGFYQIKSIRTKWKTTGILSDIGNKWASIGLASLPSIILFIAYLIRKDVQVSTGSHALKPIYHDLIEATSLVLLNGKEQHIAIVLSSLIGVSVLYAIINRVVFERELVPSDSFLLLFIFSLYVYFFTPNTMAGAGVLHIRLQILPYITIIPWICTANFHKAYKWGVIGIVTLCCVSFLYIRQPVYRQLSHAVKEYISVSKHIETESSVLPLSFSHNGLTLQDEKIANKIWLFMHAVDYIGTEKQLVLLDNYEGNTGYFPIIWRKSSNPFIHLSTNEGQEHIPPSVDLHNFNRKQHRKIDYVVLWCYRDKFKDHPYTKNLMTQLNDSYKKTYVSENGRAILYQRK